MSDMNTPEKGSESVPQPERDATGRWLPGKRPGPGRRPGSVDRVNAVLEAIGRKVGTPGHGGLVQWLSGLDDPLLAGLYAKLLPRDVQVTGEVRAAVAATGNLGRLARLIEERAGGALPDAERGRLRAIEIQAQAAPMLPAAPAAEPQSVPAAIAGEAVAGAVAEDSEDAEDADTGQEAGQ